MPRLFSGFERPLLFAHRGASARAPENTLEAFEVGARIGADVLEMDVHLTRDGEVVVFHDATVDRTTDGSGAVRDLTYKEIAELDAGFHFQSRGQYTCRGRGITVPRFEEVLRAFPRVGFNVEIKQREPKMVRQVLDVLERVGPEAVLLTAGDDLIMKELESHEPGCALGLSRSQSKAVVRAAYGGTIPPEFSGRALQIPPRIYGVIPIATRRVIKEAEAAGIETHIWTINSPRTAARWVDAGVHGVMSDDPGSMVDVLHPPRPAHD